MNRYVIFTDVDGTILDKRTYQPGPALGALYHCRERKVPVVMVSAKTRAEIEFLQNELDYTTPFVCENGGGLFLPKNMFEQPKAFDECDGYWRFQSDITVGELHRALGKIASNLDLPIMGFLDMSDEEVADLTGLSLEGAARARRREYDEPFIIRDETPEKVQAVRSHIIMLGYGYTHGGGLHHIMGRFDKGRTIRIIMNLYLEKNPAIGFVGIGDAYNDISMLLAVDHPYLVRKPDGSFEAGLEIASLRVTDGIGPAGFAEVIAALVS
jgi:mannosyl-3-phosphoglycerate phosphatase